MQKWLILSGFMLIFVGLLLPWILKFGIGRLPADLFIKKGSFSIYIPITTSILFSLVISFLLWLFHK